MSYDDYRLEQDEEVDTPPRKRKRRWAKRIGWALALLLLPLVAGALFLSSPIGKRYVANEIAAAAPASGLRFSVGRIEGDLYNKATLHDVVLSDPQGAFLTIPVVELDWRPLAWLTSGLDIREVVARRGTLSRFPELLPGDPDAPILPDFDICIDRFEIENLTLAPGIAGESAQRVNLTTQTDIRSGRVFIEADGRFGAQDTLALLIDAEPDGDRFDLALDYRAAEDGAVANMVGAKATYRARIVGDGTWSRWLGHGLVEMEGERFAGFRLTNEAGQYGLIGQLTPLEAFEGLLGGLVGPVSSIMADGTLEDSSFDGSIAWLSEAVNARGQGKVDLAGNAFEGFDVSIGLRKPDVLGDALRLEQARATATLDGKFRDLSIDHRLDIGAIAVGETQLVGLTQSGVATFGESVWSVPLDAAVSRVETGTDWIDPRLVRGNLRGTIDFDGNTVRAPQLRLAFPGVDAQLALSGNVVGGGFGLAGPVAVRDLALPDLGTANGSARVQLKIAQGAGWNLDADVDGQLGSIANTTLANLAGNPVAFKGTVSAGDSGSVRFADFSVRSDQLRLGLDGAIGESATTLAGAGEHADYGPFTVDASLATDGPRAELVFASPLPAAGLEDVRLSIAPADDALLIDAQGGSTLGPFEGRFALTTPQDGPAQIAIRRAKVWQTSVTGTLDLGEAGPTGTLALEGGGLDGTIDLSTPAGAQLIALDLQARNASFGGDTPLRLARADIDGQVRLAQEDMRISGTATAQGLTYGSFFLGRMAATADIENGRGTIAAALAGRRGSRFNIDLDANVAPQRIAALARGTFGGRDISMPRRAVLITGADDGDRGWVLQPTQVDFGDGRMVAQGRFGGQSTSAEIKLARMPMSLADLAIEDLGLGGTISGIVDFRAMPGEAPSGSARVKLEQLTRSGLVLSSRPLDVALVANLDPDMLTARALLTDGDARLGSAQTLIAGLPRTGSLFERLQQGRLDGRLQYGGAADALWRLAAIEAFDLTGPVSLRAEARGSLAEPRVTGTIASDDLRVQSGLTGTDIRSVTARGTFTGSVLNLRRFAGEAPNGGKVSGSGTVDLAGISASRGPQIDLKVALENAALLDAAGLAATVTGPLRIMSDGAGGTIAGRLRVNRASWQLGVAEDDVSIPDIATREVNTPADIAPPRAPGAPWRYLVDATARSRLDVDGLGLDSEWRADLRIRGSTADPRIGGEARLVRGFYSFAGTRFEMTRGRIDFDENVPIDPRLNIEAESVQSGIDVTVAVTGNALRPEIAFNSNPALPEEEILARLLFGDSITSLSATDALQLGAALASLRGGGGMDPINQLRTAIGLDRLRIVAADPALNRGTGVALGKNFGRRFYTEIVTDGRGYSASEVEFRITNWLSLLGSISTIGRESVLVEVSRDY